MANTGPSQAVIQYNLIQNNTQPGPATGHGVYTDEYVAGGPVSNVLIDSNHFKGHAAAASPFDGQGIGFSSTDPTKPATGITISNNVFDGNGRVLYAFKSDEFHHHR